MKIFAHRGLWRKLKEENTLEAIEGAFRAGFDLETDVRIQDSNFVIKHDPLLENEVLPKLSELFAIFEKYDDRHIAFHFKYDDWERPNSLRAVDLLAPFSDRVFIFDVSVEYCSKIKKKNKNIKTGVSVGDKKYHNAFCDLDNALNSKAIDIIWADEYRNFYSKELIDKCHQYGKLVYCISPDLAKAVGHPRAENSYQQTWQDLIKWGADGICTDHPVELRGLL